MDAEIRVLARSRDGDVTFYIVEVCTECWSNHLVRMFTAAAGENETLYLIHAPRGNSR